MAIAYHGTWALFDKFDPSHLLQGQGGHKFGVGAYLSDRYSTAALYSGKTANPDHYVYKVEIPDPVEGNFLKSAQPVNPAIVARAEAKLGMPIPAEVCKMGKFFRKWIGNTLIGQKGTLRQKKEKASLEAEKAASAFLPSIGVILLVWPTAQTKPDENLNYALLDYEAFHILQIDKVELTEGPKPTLIEGAQVTIKTF